MFLVMWNMGVINEIFFTPLPNKLFNCAKAYFQTTNFQIIYFFCILLIMTYELKSLVRFHTELPFSDSTILVSYTSYYVFENS